MKSIILWTALLLLGLSFVACKAKVDCPAYSEDCSNKQEKDHKFSGLPALWAFIMSLRAI